ncbi:hypothetical protein N7474_008810 [Penicillium riverlandense]|uniref:uncharacterized protein n=1 Tax=Penicillium riverlandense TaxID=1903569 RepID=UPI00254865AF|nr:uncharacterized protein N7474_008810 [Penicillium riverlandense]KAJ5812509.1 hypothetical protein N7474_008810 [Penicillium riverlandense]
MEAEEKRYLFRIAPTATREIERGYVSQYIRDPEGAAAYLRGKDGWEDFLQRARLGQDLNPQMKELGDSPGTKAQQALESLFWAATSIEQASDPFPPALSALADAALSEPAHTQLPHIHDSSVIPQPPHRTLLPQPSSVPPPPPMIGGHGPTDPRSFILPRPTPTQQPRRLLPARGQLGLPDPFTINGGPPQLPPPPGSNFQRLPLPNYLAPPGPPQPPSLYFPPPHGHQQHPPPPPPPPPGSRRY